MATPSIWTMTQDIGQLEKVRQVFPAAAEFQGDALPADGLLLVFAGLHRMAIADTPSDLERLAELVVRTDSNPCRILVILHELPDEYGELSFLLGPTGFPWLQCPGDLLVATASVESIAHWVNVQGKVREYLAKRDAYAILDRIGAHRGREGVPSELKYWGIARPLLQVWAIGIPVTAKDVLSSKTRLTGWVDQLASDLFLNWSHTGRSGCGCLTQEHRARVEDALEKYRQAVKGILETGKKVEAINPQAEVQHLTEFSRGIALAADAIITVERLTHAIMTEIRLRVRPSVARHVLFLDDENIDYVVSQLRTYYAFLHAASHGACSFASFGHGESFDTVRKWVEEKLGSTSRIDALFVDLDWGGKSRDEGLELIVLARRLRPHLRIAVLTSREPTRKLYAECREKGAGWVFEKRCLTELATISEHLTDLLKPDIAECLGQEPSPVEKARTILKYAREHRVDELPLAEIRMICAALEDISELHAASFLGELHVLHLAICELLYKTIGALRDKLRIQLAQLWSTLRDDVRLVEANEPRYDDCLKLLSNTNSHELILNALDALEKCKEKKAPPWTAFDVAVGIFVEKEKPAVSPSGVSTAIVRLILAPGPRSYELLAVIFVTFGINLVTNDLGVGKSVNLAELLFVFVGAILFFVASRVSAYFETARTRISIAGGGLHKEEAIAAAMQSKRGPGRWVIDAILIFLAAILVSLAFWLMPSTSSPASKGRQQEKAPFKGNVELEK